MLQAIPLSVALSLEFISRVLTLYYYPFVPFYRIELKCSDERLPFGFSSQQLCMHIFLANLLH